MIALHTALILTFGFLDVQGEVIKLGALCKTVGGSPQPFLELAGKPILTAWSGLNSTPPARYEFAPVIWSSGRIATLESSFDRMFPGRDSSKNKPYSIFSMKAYSDVERSPNPSSVVVDLATESSINEKVILNPLEFSWTYQDLQRPLKYSTKNFNEQIRRSRLRWSTFQRILEIKGDALIELNGRCVAGSWVNQRYINSDEVAWDVQGGLSFLGTLPTGQRVFVELRDADGGKPMTQIIRNIRMTTNQDREASIPEIDIESLAVTRCVVFSRFTPAVAKLIPKSLYLWSEVQATGVNLDLRLKLTPIVPR